MEFYWLHDKFHPHRKTFQQHQTYYKLNEGSYCNISMLYQKCYKQFIDGSDFKEAKIFCCNIENETKQFISNALSFLEKHQFNLENKHKRYEKLYDWKD